jgi:hypothetical protein
MSGTILGLPAGAVVNQLQNLVLLVLTYVGTRYHLSGDTTGQIASIGGAVATLVGNWLTVRPSTHDTRPQLTNGAIQPTA